MLLTIIKIKVLMGFLIIQINLKKQPPVVHQFFPECSI